MLPELPKDGREGGPNETVDLVAGFPSFFSSSSSGYTPRKERLARGTLSSSASTTSSAATRGRTSGDSNGGGSKLSHLHRSFSIGAPCPELRSRRLGRSQSKGGKVTGALLQVGGGVGEGWWWRKWVEPGGGDGGGDLLAHLH